MTEGRQFGFTANSDVSNFGSPHSMGEIVIFFTFPLELSSAETFIAKTGLCFSQWLGNQQEGVKCFSYAIWLAEGLKLQCLSVQGSNHQALQDKRDEKKNQNVLSFVKP